MKTTVVVHTRAGKSLFAAPSDEQRKTNVAQGGFAEVAQFPNMRPILLRVLNATMNQIHPTIIQVRTLYGSLSPPATTIFTVLGKKLFHFCHAGK